MHGLISGGSTGENYAQTVAERIEIARFTVEKAAGRVPVVIGTGAMLTSDSIELAAAARDMGADAILLASPPYSVPTDRENALNALAIDKAADLPIMLYNYPHRTGTMMGEEFLDRVGRSRNFCGIKESSGDINRVHLLARDYPHIQMGCGMDDQALEFFAWGSAVLGVRRIELSARRTCRPLRGLRDRRQLHQGPSHHVGNDATDESAGTGRQVHSDDQARGDHERHRLLCGPAPAQRA